MLRRLPRAAACIVLAIGGLVAVPTSADAVNGTCTVTPFEAGPVYSGGYVVAGFAVDVECTQKNVIDVWASSQPIGVTTSGSQTFDYAVCQATSCIASTSWAVKYNGVPICWADAGDGGGVDFGKDVTPIPPERCV